MDALLRHLEPGCDTVLQLADRTRATVACTRDALGRLVARGWATKHRATPRRRGLAYTYTLTTPGQAYLEGGGARARDAHRAGLGPPLRCGSTV